MISTPQEVALVSAVKGVNMFRKVGVPVNKTKFKKIKNVKKVKNNKKKCKIKIKKILGVVENMSYFQCSCGSKEYIFGKDGAKKKAKELQIDFLGEVPLNTSIRETSDSGKPIVASNPDSQMSQVYHDIAKKVIEKLDNQKETMKITIE